MKYTYFITTLILFLMLGSGIAGAQVYKWVDEDGKVHYSDTPVDAKTAKRVRVSKTPRSAKEAQAAAAAKEAQGDAMDKKTDKKLAKEDQAKADAKAQELKKYCDALTARIKTLGSGARLTTFNAKGEQEWYDEARTKRELAQARNDFNSRCKDKK